MRAAAEYAISGHPEPASLPRKVAVPVCGRVCISGYRAMPPPAHSQVQTDGETRAVRQEPLTTPESAPLQRSNGSPLQLARKRGSQARWREIGMPSRRSRCRPRQIGPRKLTVAAENPREAVMRTGSVSDRSQSRNPRRMLLGTVSKGPADREDGAGQERRSKADRQTPPRNGQYFGDSADQPSPKAE
jgi:hypothetical protein